MAVFAGEPINHSTLTRLHGIFVNETPISLVEVERFLTGDRIMGIAVPCDQSELGKLPNDDGVSCGSHEPIMRYAGSIFKPHGSMDAPIRLFYGKTEMRPCQAPDGSGATWTPVFGLRPGRETLSRS